MKRTAIFTIVTKNYVGLANVLMQSVATNGQLENAETMVFLADEIEDTHLLKTTADQLVLSKGIISNEALWLSAAFKYNVTEFCTFLKPYCFEYLIEKGFDNIIYFDPDIYVFNSLQKLTENLDRKPVVLTPHITYPGSCKTNPVFTDISFASHGIFNLGFCAIQVTDISRKLMAWWKEMVTDHGFIDYGMGMATDQKWMDFAPAFLGENLFIERDPGYNAAFWNIQEREIITSQQTLTIRQRNDRTSLEKPLVFFHFSALYYPDIYDFSKSKYAVDFVALFPDLKKIFSIYAPLVSHSFATYSSLKYSYGVYDNGVAISHLNRRIYRKLLEEGLMKDKHTNPFAAAAPFYSTLKKNNLIAAKNIVHTTPAFKNSAETSEGKSNLQNRGLKIFARLFGLKMINKLIYIGKGIGKEEVHSRWLKEDFVAALKKEK